LISWFNRRLSSKCLEERRIEFFPIVVEKWSCIENQYCLTECKAQKYGMSLCFILTFRIIRTLSIEAAYVKRRWILMKIVERGQLTMYVQCFQWINYVQMYLVFWSFLDNCRTKIAFFSVLSAFQTVGGWTGMSKNNILDVFQVVVFYSWILPVSIVEEPVFTQRSLRGYPIYFMTKLIIFKYGFL
jgi:hypothetical protein